MAANTKLEKLRAQLIATESLLAVAGDSIIMRASLEKRIAKLKAQIEDYSQTPGEARFSVWFSGGGVYGSQGIEQSFMENTSRAIVGMINASTRQTIQHYREEHKRADMPKGQFYITDLTRGSFGYEMTFKDEQGTLFDDPTVIDSIQNVMTVIDHTTAKGLDLDALSQEQPLRLLRHLKEFYTTLKKKNSIFKMESGPRMLDLDLPRVNSGYDNICLSEVTECEEVITATFKGALMESGRFECKDANGIVTKGTISEDLSSQDIETMLRDYSGRECQLRIMRRAMTYSGGRTQGRESIELIGIVGMETEEDKQ